MPLLDAEDLADFIASRYGWASKIVETGVGFQFDVALALKKRLQSTRIVVVDRNPRSVEAAKRVGLEAYLDDVWSPNLKIYQGASLMYAIRPPPELVNPILRIACSVNCDLLIRPLSGESLDLPRREGWVWTVNGRARFYLNPRLRL